MVGALLQLAKIGSTSMMDRAGRFYFAWPLICTRGQIGGLPMILPRSLNMSNDIPARPDGPADLEITELVAQAEALAKKVEALPNGPLKKKLGAALTEILSELDDTESDKG
jgi:hypothetical protein